MKLLQCSVCDGINFVAATGEFVGRGKDSNVFVAPLHLLCISCGQALDLEWLGTPPENLKLRRI